MWSRVLILGACTLAVACGSDGSAGDTAPPGGGSGGGAGRSESSAGASGHATATGGGAGLPTAGGDAGADTAGAAGDTSGGSPTCAAPLANCDDDLRNGCETNTSSDSQNCDGCGVVCAAGTQCVASKCACTPQSCPDGCCDTNGVCRAPSVAACGNSGAQCTSCDDGDACNVDLCDAQAGCAHVDASGCATPFCKLGSSCNTWLDSDGDGLSDAWETNGYVDLDCNGTNDGPSVDLELPGADPAVPDVYVQYDWMDYGPMEAPCNTAGDCTTRAGLKGATCTGPALSGGFTGSCVLPCIVDADCVALGATHATDRCQQTGVKQCLHTHDPALLVPNGTGGSKALDAVVEAYARHGINLHLIRGNPLPHSHLLSFRTLAGASPIANACEGGSVASGTAGAGKYAESFYDLKAGSFDPKRAPAYHYAIFGHDGSCDTAAHCQACPEPLSPDGMSKSADAHLLGTSGYAEESGNDFMVTLASYSNEAGNPPDLFNVGGSFMHELGHNLGLSHGGWYMNQPQSSPNYRPNFLSVMNYSYQFVGIGVGAQVGDNTPKSCATDTDCASPAHCSLSKTCRRLDYSTQALPAGTATPGLLDENGHLNETAGLGSGNSDTFFYTDAACVFHEAASNGPVDWDGNGVAGDNATATADLNPADHTGTPCGSSTTEQFRSNIDWGAHGNPLFTYAFQCASPGGD